MANPQPTDAHLRIAHSILEAILLRDFSKRQLNILLFILRLSWGCKAGSSKKYAIIPRQKDFGIVGIGEGHIKTELTWLVSSKILFTDGERYWFNKDFDEWQVSRVNPYLPSELTELVSLNIKNGEELTKTGSIKDNELTETVSENLPKREESAYRNGKFPTSKLATPKERLNKYINKESYISITNKKVMMVGLAYKKKKAELGRELTTEERVEIAAEVDRKIDEEMKDG